MVRRELRKWRRGEGDRDRYRERKRKYKEMIETKKREENEKWEREIQEIRTEGQVWEVVRRERKTQRRVNEEIEIEEWDGYFRRLLGGVEEKVVRGITRGIREDEEEGISKEEIEVALRGMKNNKAAGLDEIPAEAWKYGGEEMKDWIWRVCNRIWRGEGWIEEWKEGVIVPIVKKGEGVKVEEYRGVSLMPTLYKMYTSVLANRLGKEVEEKKLVPQNQTGFRRGLGTMDNIFVINYLINKQINRTGGKVVVFFVDFRAAFDWVDRGKLVKAMRERGVREGLVARCEDILRETRSRVRVGGEVGKQFWMGRGVRQGFFEPGII